MWDAILEVVAHGPGSLPQTGQHLQGRHNKPLPMERGRAFPKVRQKHELVQKSRKHRITNNLMGKDLQLAWATL
eukprot:11181956-Lingulodinium_polyedra.AAC.1